MITKLYLTLFLLLCLVTTQAFAADSLPLPAVVAAQEIAVPVLPTVTVELNGRQITVEIENPANPLVVLTTTRGDLLLELFPNEAPETVANFLGLAEGTKLFTDPVTGQQAIRPFYDGLTFHRVIDGFMIQSGSPTGTSDGGPGFTFNDEINAVSLGIDRMPLLDEDGYPNPVLGIRSQEDFRQRVLVPLYAAMDITSKAMLETRLDEVEQRLRTMTVKQSFELLGYRYTEAVNSHAPVRGVIGMANTGPSANGSQFFITLVDTEWLTGKHTVFGKVRAGLDIVDAIGKVRVNGEGQPLQDVTITSIRRVGSEVQAQPAQF